MLGIHLEGYHVWPKMGEERPGRKRFCCGREQQHHGDAPLLH